MSKRDASIKSLRTLQQKGEHAAVIELCEALEKPLDPHADLLYYICTLLYSEGQEPKAPLVDSSNNGDHRYASDLALYTLLIGNAYRALELVSGALQQCPTDPVAHGRAGAIHLTLGDLDNASHHYREAVNLEPGRPEWHSNLAGILVRQQELEQALEEYDVALRLKPDFAPAKEAKAQLLTALERNEEVIEELYDDLDKSPEAPDLRIRLARALAQENRLAEAVNLIREKLLPVSDIGREEDTAQGLGTEDSVDAWSTQVRFREVLADLFENRQMFGKVLIAANQGLQLEPAHRAPLIQKKVQALTELGRYEEAESVLDEESAGEADSTRLQLARAGLYNESGRYVEAEAIQRRLIEAYPGNVRLKSQLGQTLLWTGKLDEAVTLFEQAAEANPMALAQIVNAKRVPNDPAALDKMAAIADNALVLDQARSTMAFALGELYDKRKEYDKAFHYLSLANHLTDKQLNYSTEKFSTQVDKRIEIYSADFLESQPPVRDSERTPIFVVGMPRSGTTLTEQILCSHPDIFGAGELGLLPQLTRLMPRALKKRWAYPRCAKYLTVHLREEAARFYLHGLEDYDDQHQFVVDKLPHNFMNLGLINQILPKAKIIHIQRDPRDTALSNYQQNFKAKHGGLGYAFDLEKIAHELNDYHRMMAHWRKVLTMPIFELTYEEMVADQERTTRELLDFVGVNWDENVLNFHKTERAVRTASVAQVRQGIYKTSSQKWRGYADHLGPLLENLNPELTEPYDELERQAGKIS